MPSTARPYRRLPGTGYQIFGRRVQLWQGAEHLLLVEWDGYREYYKRFDYRDIQAFTIRKSIEGKAFNAILGTLVSVLVVLAMLAPEIELRVFALVLAGVLGLMLMANALLGPTCRCSLRTAVQTHELPSLRRLRRARKVLAHLRPLIGASQGQLNPEEIPVRMRELDKMSAATTPVPAVPQRFIIDDPNIPPRIL
jgi:hypothetical protein